MQAAFFRDKDYVNTSSGVIFKIKDYYHPQDCVLAFPRFIPFDVIPMRLWEHTWMIRGREYSRFDLRVTSTNQIRETFERFYATYPQFAPDGREDSGAACVPLSLITEHLTPGESLARIWRLPKPDALQATACKFAKICLGLGIPTECLGVTDSLMFDAHTLGFSDVDFVIAGGRHYERVISYLQSETCDPSISFPTMDEWHQRYETTGVKDLPLSGRVYALHKIRKREEFWVDGHKMSLFAVREHRPTEPFAPSVPLGPVQLTGTVVDATEGMYRPSVYRVRTHRMAGSHLDHSDIVTVVNHRREYISQVMEGEEIEALGLASRINGGVLLELGSLELRGRDYLVVKGLM
jgi:predicted nucleotidyltransferase